MPNLSPSLKKACGRALLGILLGLWAARASAEKAQFAYDLSLSGSLALLQANGSSMSTNSLPGDLVNKLNNPWLKLTNNSDDATLDRFVMTVGNDDFHFSQFTIGSQLGTFDIDVNIIDGGKNLELVFTNFNPGETIYVQFQLRPDDANLYPFPDFQNVLFDANGNSSADNSLLTAVFNDPVTMQDNTLTGNLPDFLVTGNAAISSGCARCMCFPLGGSTIQAFRFGQEDSLDPPAVPEPASWLLMIVGTMVTLGTYHRRRGRRAHACD